MDRRRLSAPEAEVGANLVPGRYTLPLRRLDDVRPRDLRGELAPRDISGLDIDLLVRPVAKNRERPSYRCPRRIQKNLPTQLPLNDL